MHAAKLTYHQEFRVCSLFQPYTLKTLLRNRLAKDRIWTPPRLQTIRIQAVRYNCSRISGLLLLHLYQVLDPDGLFARRLPIAFTGLKASVILGFCQRRVRPVGHHAACHAIVVRMLLHVQIAVAAALTTTGLMQATDHNQCLCSSSPRRYALSCWPRPPQRY
jgi:hypothetical protein